MRYNFKLYSLLALLIISNLSVHAGPCASRPQGAPSEKEIEEWYLAPMVDGLPKVVRMLKRHPLLLNRVSRDRKRTALHAAVVFNQPDILTFLISRRADCNLADDEGNTPLMEASFCGQVETVQKLLKAGANPHIRSSTLGTAFDAAAGISVYKAQEKRDIKQSINNHISQRNAAIKKKEQQAPSAIN